MKLEPIEWSICVHEAGHIVYGVVLGLRPIVVCVEPDGKFLAWVLCKPAQFADTPEAKRREIGYCVAGGVAVEMLIGPDAKLPQSCDDDISRANRAALLCVGLDAPATAKDAIIDAERVRVRAALRPHLDIVHDIATQLRNLRWSLDSARAKVAHRSAGDRRNTRREAAHEVSIQPMAAATAAGDQAHDQREEPQPQD